MTLLSSSSCGFESHYRRLASILYKYTPAELQKLLDTSNGYCDLLRKVGLNGHGSNPETLKKLIDRIYIKNVLKKHMLKIHIN